MSGGTFKCNLTLGEFGKFNCSGIKKVFVFLFLFYVNINSFFRHFTLLWPGLGSETITFSRLWIMVVVSYI